MLDKVKLMEATSSRNEIFVGMGEKPTDALLQSALHPAGHRKQLSDDMAGVGWGGSKLKSEGLVFWIQKVSVNQTTVF